MDNEPSNLECAKDALNKIKSYVPGFSLEKTIGVGIIYALLAVVDAINMIESDTIDIHSVLNKRL